MINKFQSLKSQSKTKYNRTVCNYYDEKIYFRSNRKFHFEEDVFCKNAQVIA